MIYPLIIYTVFTILATVGLFLIGSHFHSRSLGIKLAAGAVVFFVALILGLSWMIRHYGG